MVIVKLEGQDIQLPDEAAASDDLVRKALVPYFPDVANAEIKRETKDGQTTVTVVKRAGPKGCWVAADDVLAALFAAPRHVNPAVALCLEIRRLEAEGDLSLETLLALRPQIDAAIPEAVEEAQEVQRAWRAARQAEPIPAAGVPAGF